MTRTIFAVFLAACGAAPLEVTVEAEHPAINFAEADTAPRCPPACVDRSRSIARDLCSGYTASETRYFACMVREYEAALEACDPSCVLP